MEAVLKKDEERVRAGRMERGLSAALRHWVQ